MVNAPHTLPASSSAPELDLARVAQVAKHVGVNKGQETSSLDQSPKEKLVFQANTNPDMWDPADLVAAQHFNALYPHPESRQARSMKAQSATGLYSKLTV